MATEISQSKTICILAVVAGCFAILWPSLFYPMLKGSFAPPTHTDNIYQERTPVHLRASKASMHPALMEKGRAIPQPHIGPRHGSATPHSFKPPIPGSRPTMGGMGVASNKITGGDGGSAMNILMPMYTIGILLFFVYTMMKLLSKKDEVEDPIGDKYSSHYPCNRDNNSKLQPQNLPTKLGFIEKDTRDLEIDALRRKLEETEAAMERIVKQMILASECNGMDGNKEFKNENIDEGECLTNTISNDNVNDKITTKKSAPSEESESIKSLNISEPNDEDTTDSEISVKKIIQVVNMETSESVGGGHCWTPTEKEKIPSKCKITSIEEPISLLIPGMIPKNSQVLISDGPHNTPLETEDHEAVISSKVTLSLIPDDRIEEYLTSDEAEDDNTTSTLSNIK
ncbi:resistance to inhibitors of cholinesterase protein 3-like isoform X3 [Rhopalosiphum maidis]|uniref:resistance to inhibitors of cholinesterase protein 3-like isoform X3 n=1 Tax=Rhopalosiphum maidis TaxID=43146 RepID=UPI000EFE4842|nr:resistance to inhibitors of cholinesterase protein 3-like isoform X3 [Rhopalosiphum maidis]